MTVLLKLFSGRRRVYSGMSCFVAIQIAAIIFSVENAELQKILLKIFYNPVIFAKN